MAEVASDSFTTPALGPLPNHYKLLLYIENMFLAQNLHIYRLLTIEWQKTFPMGLLA
jgi:hypothetical protein